MNQRMKMTNKKCPHRILTICLFDASEMYQEECDNECHDYCYNPEAPEGCC